MSKQVWGGRGGGFGRDLWRHGLGAGLEFLAETLICVICVFYRMYLKENEKQRVCRDFGNFQTFIEFLEVLGTCLFPLPSPTDF